MQFITIASTIFSAVSAISRGNQQAQQVQHQSQVEAVRYESAAQANEYDAAIARKRAETARIGAGLQEDQQRRRARLEAGARRAAIAQSGTGFGGSNLDVDRQSQIFAEMDALNIRYQGSLEAKGLEDSADLSDWQASANRTGASNSISAGSSYASAARKSGYMGAAGAILSGAGDYISYGRKRTTNGAPAPSMYGLYGGAANYGMLP